MKLVGGPVAKRRQQAINFAFEAAAIEAIGQIVVVGDMLERTGEPAALGDVAEADLDR